MVKFKESKVTTLIGITVDVEVNGIKAEVDVQFATGIHEGKVYVDGADVVDYTNVTFMGNPAPADYKSWGLWVDNFATLTGKKFSDIVDNEVEKLLTENVLRDIASRLRPTKKISEILLITEGATIIKVENVE